MATHPLSGKKQSPDHVRKRVESVAKAKSRWSDERRKECSLKLKQNNPMKSEAARKKMAQSLMGKTPWNKGNNWRNGLSAAEIRAKAAEKSRRHRKKQWVLIHGRMSTRVRQSLKGSKNRAGWESLVGYSVKELESRLMATIPNGYSWEDFLSADLEIDHILPVSSFKINSPSDPAFKECWSLSNLRLLPAIENNRKGNRIILTA